jgi:hypothetical protein
MIRRDGYRREEGRRVKRMDRKSRVEERYIKNTRKDKEWSRLSSSQLCRGKRERRIVKSKQGPRVESKQEARKKKVFEFFLSPGPYSCSSHRRTPARQGIVV